jgi:hypothetical protein
MRAVPHPIEPTLQITLYTGDVVGIGETIIFADTYDPHYKPSDVLCLPTRRHHCSLPGPQNYRGERASLPSKWRVRRCRYLSRSDQTAGLYLCPDPSAPLLNHLIPFCLTKLWIRCHRPAHFHLIIRYPPNTPDVVDGRLSACCSFLIRHYSSVHRLFAEENVIIFIFAYGRTTIPSMFTPFKKWRSVRLP